MLTRLYLHTKQFDRTVLDFTHPETGEPLKKICLIGSNGTGKSSILKILTKNNQFDDDFEVTKINEKNLKIDITSMGHTIYDIEVDKFNLIGKEFLINEKYYIYINICYVIKENLINNDILLHKIFNLKKDKFFILYNNNFNFSEFIDLLKDKLEVEYTYGNSTNIKSILHDLNYNILNDAESNDNKLLYRLIPRLNLFNYIYIPDEYQSNYLLSNPLPKSTLGEANAYKHLDNQLQIISNDTIEEFWKSLMYHTNFRRREQDAYEKLDENLNKTKAQLIKEFNDNYPDIIDKMADFWNKILDKCGLELDKEHINYPYQISDNFEMFIKLKNEDSQLTYDELSTGIRNYIFKVGHLFSLYFNNNIRNSYVLFDEAENGLYPDFLLDMIEIYEKIVEGTNTQMFFSTHSPIIASQFEKHEKIILSWNENYKVDARKGSSPIGDDPNDVLNNDFNMPNITNKKGQDAWQQYLKLKRKIRDSKDLNLDKDLIEEYTKIANEYNFD